MTLRIAILLAVAGFCAVSDVDGQVLRGRLTDPILGQGVAGAEIVLRSNDSLIGRTTSDSTGAFLFRAPRPGSYKINVLRIGYREFTSDMIPLKGDEITEVAVSLSSAPIGVDALVVTSRRPMPLGNLAEFERRRSEGVGYFFTQKDIQSRSMATAATLLLPVPGITLDRSGQSKLGGREGYRVLFGGRGIASCFANIYIDGVYVPSDAMTLDDRVDLASVAGVEVYSRRIDVPIQYRRNDCGAVLFWTRSGEKTRGSTAKLYIGAGAVLAVIVGFYFVK
jgi:hypothetical protein